jgi:integrase
MEYRDIHNTNNLIETSLNIINSSLMTSKQKKDINLFVQDLKLGKIGKKVKERRIKNYLQFIIRLHEYFQKDFNKITDKEATKFYQDLQENKIKRINGMPYSQSTKDEFVKTLKRFLGWSWGRNSIQYKKSISWMKEDYKTSDKKAITLKECESIVQNEKELRNKCLFKLLFDSGARIEEALNIKISDLKVVDNGQKYFLLHLRGTKTPEANRTIAIPLSTKELNLWLKKHPTRNDNDYLFPIRYDNARKIIKIMSKKVLNFYLKPHELRHSSATHYIQHGGFGAENIGGFYYRYGWKFGSKEALTYIKTYLYGGEIGQEKVVKFIENCEIEKLQKENTQKTEIIKLMIEILEINNKDKQILDKIQKIKHLSKKLNYFMC